MNSKIYYLLLSLKKETLKFGRGWDRKGRLEKKYTEIIKELKKSLYRGEDIDE